jgi:hypothetical protein
MEGTNITYHVRMTASITLALDKGEELSGDALRAALAGNLASMASGRDAGVIFDWIDGADITLVADLNDKPIAYSL